GIGESACDPIAKALHVTIAPVLSVHGQAWSISPKRRALIQIVDKPHGLPPGKKMDGAVPTRHPVASIVNRQDWVHHQAEASQLAEQFPMPERLTGGGKANLLGSSLQQREGGVGLQHSGLLVIAIPVDHA